VVKQSLADELPFFYSSQNCRVLNHFIERGLQDNMLGGIGGGINAIKVENVAVDAVVAVEKSRSSSSF
jgi:hypothetical protein